MKYKNFEYFLMWEFSKEEPMVLDDDLPDAFEAWIQNLDIDRWLFLEDKYAQSLHIYYAQELTSSQKLVLEKEAAVIESERIKNNLGGASCP